MRKALFLVAAIAVVAFAPLLTAPGHGQTRPGLERL